jgi:hypothetical protein
MDDDTAGHAPPKRDVRIDRVGFAEELVTHFAAPLRKKIKAYHVVGSKLTADHFCGEIIPCVDTHVPAALWLDLFAKGIITQPQMLSGLSVSTTAARKVLSEADFARVAVTSPGTPRLAIARHKGASPDLVRGIIALSNFLDADRQAADQGEPGQRRAG